MPKSSLYADSKPLRVDLGGKPPFNMEEGLRRMFVGLLVNRRKAVHVSES
jgi:hypothetical protein